MVRAKPKKHSHSNFHTVTFRTVSTQLQCWCRRIRSAAMLAKKSFAQQMHLLNCNVVWKTERFIQTMSSPADL